MMSSSKILFVPFLLILSLQSIECIPTNPTNCTLFAHVKAATDAIGQYQAWLYNYQWALESNITGETQWSIATNLFDGLRLTAVAGIYSRLLNTVQDDPELQNYAGFNNTNIPGFFGNFLSLMVRDMCTWLLSYGDSITARSHVNCSHPAEQLLLSQFSMVMPIVHQFQYHFENQFNCPSPVSYDNWVESNLLSEFKPEINYLRGLFNHPLYP